MDHITQTKIAGVLLARFERVSHVALFFRIGQIGAVRMQYGWALDFPNDWAREFLDYKDVWLTIYLSISLHISTYMVHLCILYLWQTLQSVYFQATCSMFPIAHKPNERVQLRKRNKYVLIKSNHCFKIKSPLKKIMYSGNWKTGKDTL